MPCGNFALTNQKHYPDQGSDVFSVWNFGACFPRRHFLGKPVVVSQNLGCFLRLLYFLSQNELNDMTVIIQLWVCNCRKLVICQLGCIVPCCLPWKYSDQVKQLLNSSSGGFRGGQRDQTEAQRAEKMWMEIGKNPPLPLIPRSGFSTE